MTSAEILGLLEKSIRARDALFDDRHETALRLFNGFLEGAPTLAIDLYAKTIVLHNYAKAPELEAALLDAVQVFLRAALPWIQAILVKTRQATSIEDRHGRLVFGTLADRRVLEYGVWYAVDLCLNRDASLYLDTRNVRHWAIQHLGGKSVLNTFAYTGSLGVAALAGGARRVVQLDRNRLFLNLAKTTYTLNGFPIDKKDFQVGDFWTQVNHLKRAGERFDCVFVDPPFFAATSKGTVDLARNSARLINKVRPLVSHDGYLVAVNNALFVSGKEYLETLEGLCADGYLQIETLLAVPPDFTGYPETLQGSPITDPAPFNHATKIALLKVSRKTA